MLERVSVTAPTRAPGGATNAYVSTNGSGLLIDPPTRSDELDEILPPDIEHVAVTHHHPDHVGGVAAYARAFDLTVWARRGRADAFESAAGIAPDRLFSPGETIPETGGVGVIDTPGHAPEHVAFEMAGELVTGDLAVLEGSVVVGAPEGDMRAYLSSLRRVHARNPERLYPGHGPVIDDPRTTCRRLIEHRLDRERKVLAAIQGGNRTPDDIVEAAYEKDVSAVYDLARATVVAHIEKLVVEGKVGYDGEQATPL